MASTSLPSTGGRRRFPLPNKIDATAGQSTPQANPSAATINLASFHRYREQFC